MINSNNILYIIFVFVAFTLFYTYNNDFSVFLLTFLLVLGAFWCYLYISEFIKFIDNKILTIEKNIGDKIYFLINKLFNMKSLRQEKINELNNLMY